MPKRQKCDSCSSGWCSNHLFSLNPLKNNLYFRKIQKVRLCPRLNKYFLSYPEPLTVSKSPCHKSTTTKNTTHPPSFSKKSILFTLIMTKKCSKLIKKKLMICSQELPAQL